MCGFQSLRTSCRLRKILAAGRQDGRQQAGHRHSVGYGAALRHGSATSPGQLWLRLWLASYVGLAGRWVSSAGSDQRRAELEFLAVSFELRIEFGEQWIATLAAAAAAAVAASMQHRRRRLRSRSISVSGRRPTHRRITPSTTSIPPPSSSPSRPIIGRRLPPPPPPPRAVTSTTPERATPSSSTRYWNHRRVRPRCSGTSACRPFAMLWRGTIPPYCE